MPPKPAKQLTLKHEPEAVRYARDKAQLKQKQAAGLIGISPQLLADIEAGRRSATTDTLHKMAQVYNCPIVILERKRWVA